MKRARSSLRRPRWLLTGATGAALTIAIATGCTGEDATPLTPGSSTVPTTPHQLEPTEQMQELAEQQCRDDPSLDEGVVEAVDPSNPDQVLASVVVDCAEIR